jgi:DNA (cytosine-5)-methyltransferase 1
MEKFKLLDLFSGIGGLSLGLERTGGFETVAFCEIEPFPRRVLAKHWPKVPIYDDVRTLTAERLAADGIAVDAICGGFPCQDISLAGHGAGLDGERSGLWSEIARLVGELGPRYVIVENVAALLGRGLDRVLRDLAALGYDAEWHCIPASAVGAPHRRDRIWIVAYAGSDGHWPNNVAGQNPSAAGPSEGEGNQWQRFRPVTGRGGPSVADPVFAGLSFFDGLGDSGQARTGILARRELERVHAEAGAQQWGAEPDVGRVANGVPDRAHRLKALGNAVVPQIPELIGNAILAAHHGSLRTEAAA